MRIVAMLLGVWLLVAARPAEACGYWSMTDKAKKLEIGFLINSAEIKTEKKKRVGAFYLDVESKSGMRDAFTEQELNRFLDNLPVQEPDPGAPAKQKRSRERH